MASDKRFHMALFTHFAPGAWLDPFAGEDAASDWVDGSYYVDMMQAIERACFDYVILEDSLMVADNYGGTAEADLKHALHAPKHDPVALVAMLASHTKKIGLVPTMSTSFYEPYTLARVLSTIDHMSHGRVGWNIVTSSEDRAAQNYGRDKLAEHDSRYDRADEFIEVATKLWESWEPDALVTDRESGTYVDFRKVHPINYEGKYYRSRGPLNTLPSPQRRPVFSQAGGSPRGREFAAKHAEVILAIAPGIDAMREYTKDIKDRLEKNGRGRDAAKLLFIVQPILGTTDAEARARQEAMWSDDRADLRVQKTLAHMAALTQADFSGFDLDGPVPELPTNGHRAMLEDWYRTSKGKTLRQAAADWTINCVPLVGAPDTVAEEMGEIMAEVGADGYLVGGGLPSRRQILEWTDGLAPALQRRGLMRTSLPHATFRENLFDF